MKRRGHTHRFLSAYRVIAEAALVLAIIVLVGLLLAYANGANDNFKGVATLFGSGTTSYRRALLWATATTVLGSLTALVLAEGLRAAFSGQGLVSAQVVGDPRFPAAVALAAGATVLLATRLGFPISTTHALVGALVGAGLVASDTGIDSATLASAFAVPLLTIPLLAIVLAGLVYRPLRFTRRALGISHETCVCVGQQVVAVVAGMPGSAQALNAVSLPTMAVGTKPTCQVRYRGRVLGLSAGRALDVAHYLSGGAVSFARGLNDTPKIAALLLVGNTVSPDAAIAGVAVAIAAGGLVSARRVAETMSHRVTEMNPGQGLTANIVTSLLVIGASKLGVPVSTTHVSCGSLFGIGAVTGRAHWRVIGNILLAWVITLPVAALLGALLAAILGAGS